MCVESCLFERIANPAIANSESCVLALNLVETSATGILRGLLVEYNKGVGVKVARPTQSSIDVPPEVFSPGSAFQSEFPVFRLVFGYVHEMLNIACFQWSQQYPMVFEYNRGSLLRRAHG
jgi:hypothetical protein